MRNVYLQGRDESGTPVEVEMCFVSHLDPNLERDILDLPPDVDFTVMNQTIEQIEDRLLLTLFVRQNNIAR